ncbi:MAG: YraN family protein [Lachnospiraceae bacterium]|nr:YraN family protein [Lachnospiraceae bacterium]
MEELQKRNTVATGRQYEEAAYKYLEKAGMKMLEKNFRSRQGEVDLIGIHQGCLVFVEVKYRRSNKSGMPEEAVGEAKQKKICQTSDYYRMKHPELAGMQIRYDVLALSGEEVRWHQNAFPYRTGRRGISW